MTQIDKLLAQNYTLQDVPTKPGLGPKVLKDIVSKMQKNQKQQYLDISERIQKQLGKVPHELDFST